MKTIKCVLFALLFLNLFSFNCFAKNNKEKNEMVGVYESDGIKYEFKNGKCYGYHEGELFSECYVKIKGNLIYVSPHIPEMKNMTRNVWTVWELKGDSFQNTLLIWMMELLFIVREKAKLF